jgi:large subunit ribosomal protein L29
MKASEIRELSDDALMTRLNDTREELMRLRFQQSTGELTDTSRLRQVRRDISRLLTILNERNRSVRMEVSNE